MCKYTGHKVWWYDHHEWKSRQDGRDHKFWQLYRTLKETDPNHPKVQSVRFDARVGALYDRKALNSPTQATGIIILKRAMAKFFRWIVSNGYFGKVLLVNLIHDEAVVEYPKELTKVPTMLSKYMEDAAAEFCKSLPIPAVPEIAEHWVN